MSIYKITTIKKAFVTEDRLAVQRILSGYQDPTILHDINACVFPKYVVSIEKETHEEHDRDTLMVTSDPSA